MTPKDVRLSSHARSRIPRRHDTLNSPPKVTLAPKGRDHTLENSYGPPHITKDGVTDTKKIALSDELENMGAQMVREVVSRRMILPATAPPPRPCSPPRS